MHEYGSTILHACSCGREPVCGHQDEQPSHEDEVKKAFPQAEKHNLHLKGGFSQGRQVNEKRGCGWGWCATRQGRTSGYGVIYKQKECVSG